ncbi:MAG TPA: hypothetical protein VHX87_09425 [Galbitalea sp.]|jgi:hypothetical protein|nr:hypothetical protein [Galbitalea sp.]
MTPTRRGVRAILLLPALVLIGSLAACAPAVPTTTSPPSASASAKPTAAPNTPPAVAFGGNCESMLETKTATAFLGAPVSLAASPIVGPPDYAVTSLGGLECIWSDPTSKGEQFLDVFALRADLEPPGDKPLDCDAGSGADQCYFNVVDGGYWFSGHAIAVNGVTATPTPAAVASIEALLKADAKTASAPPATKAVAGAWTKPADCNALNTAAGIVAASGSPTLQANPLDTESDAPDAYYTALTTSGYLGCAYASDGTVATGKLQGFTVELAPGGAWAQKLLSSPPEAGYTKASVSIPGTDAAYTFSDTQGIEYIEVFKGVNWVAFEPFGGPISVAQLTPVIGGILKALH